MQRESTEVVVVGAGPIGLELAVALKRAGVDFVHVDSKQIGATIQWWAPGTRWFSSNDRISIAGVPLVTPDQGKATREQYLAYLRGIVQQFDLDVRTYEPVVDVRRTGNRFTVITRPGTGERSIDCQSIVLCTGGTERPRRLDISGERLPHVSSYFQDPHTYFRRKLLIVGGRNSAVEATLRCHAAGADVSISYRRESLPVSSIKYWLMPEMTGLLKSGKIGSFFNTVPTHITPAHVTLRSTQDSSEVKVDADFVLLMIGYLADMSLCKIAGVELVGEQQVPRYDPETMETNVPGVYVAGTVVAGTQSSYRVFLENCHVHVDRIVASLRNESPPPVPEPNERPES
jgi:thioredoxin reductase (NADPH)